MTEEKIIKQDVLVFEVNALDEYMESRHLRVAEVDLVLETTLLKMRTIVAAKVGNELNG